MATNEGAHVQILRELAGLMLAVAGESVTMMKRSVPDRALKLKKPQEWNIYLEFLKILFNLADRLVAFHLPIHQRPEFMNGLEDTVSQQLKVVLAPALGSEGDQMEVVVTIGKTVAESRRTYEPYAFIPTEESSHKEQFLKLFGERVAQTMDVPGNALVISSAMMCINAAVPAMNAAFIGATARDTAAPQVESPSSGHPIGDEIKLISVMSAIEGESVETRWGLHPRFRQDLKREEIQQLSGLMNRLSRLLGERYATVAFSEEWASWHHAGHA